MRTLIKNVSVLPMTGRTDLIKSGYIAISGRQIESVGAETIDESGFDRVIDGKDRLAMPGLVNAHTHVAMALLRGYADDLPLMEWLEKHIWPMEDRLSPEDIYWGSLLGMAEMIKSGTTCLADMYFHVDQIARAADKSGLRAVLSRGMVGIGPESEQAIADSRALVADWNEYDQGRIKIMLGPHAPYTCPPEYLKRVIALSDELRVGIHIHLSETRTEFHDITQQYGHTPIGLMNSLGLFKRPVLAAHCVHLIDDDIKTLADYQVGVAHNPISNMKLASGVARVPEMLSAGLAVALGTDGPASNNNLDMFEEMRASALLHKVQSMDPMVVPAYQALTMGIGNGAKALGMSEQIGQLKPGYQADLILVDFDQAHLVPNYDSISHLVYAARGSDVDTVIVAGQILMESKQLTTINEAEVIAQVRERVARLTANG
ncbi:MAG: amidohydrolase [Methylocystaceae bacterium]